MTNQPQEKHWAEAIGEPAYENIAAMVAALECDYDMLEELKENRDDWEPDDNDGEIWAAANQADDEHLDELIDAAGDCEDQDDARQRIDEDPLSVEVRSGWMPVGSEFEADEYRILLTTGGPGVQIVGDLNEHGEPTSAQLQVQDWWKPWREYCKVDHDVLLTYANCFCFVS